ncbi:hypothetical protein RhiirC2_764664, partial [Rhizophagus irregularis]
NSDTIRKFKRSHKTKEAFYCLFEVDDDKTLLYKTTTVMDTTFTLAVCEIVLNPRHPKISVSDNALHRRFNVYLLS